VSGRARKPVGLGEDGLPAGLDYAALLDALAACDALDTDPEDQDSKVADREAAEAEGRLTSADPARVAAQAVEHMDPGPAQAGWLEVAAAGADRLDEYGLAGVAIANRRASSRTQAAELAAVARICAAAAKADPKIGLRGDGRPARVGRDALAQVAMALKLTHYGAEEWAELAVTLAWRLPATGQALAAGRVDLDRAEAIANATSVLDEDTARQVEAKILPEAGTITRALLRERLARAVIAADPEGAERRREQAERHADVRLYADDDHTATITASKLAQIEAAAGFARVTALARARQAAGLPGSLGFHRGQVLIGMMLGTLPFIPPPQDAPPDQPPPDGPEDHGPEDHDPGPAGGGPRGDRPGGDHHHGGGYRPGSNHSGGDRPADGGPGHDTGPGTGEPGHGPSDGDPGDSGPGGSDSRGDSGGSGDSTCPSDSDGSDSGSDDRRSDDALAGGGPWDEVPVPGDEDAPPEDDLDHVGEDAGQGWDPAEEDDDPFGTRTAPAWPQLGTIPPALARPPRPGGRAAGARAAGRRLALDHPGRPRRGAGDPGPDRPRHRRPGPPARPGRRDRPRRPVAGHRHQPPRAGHRGRPDPPPPPPGPRRPGPAAGRPAGPGWSAGSP